MVTIPKEIVMKIMVCSDGSERAREALLSAAIIAAATKAEITILGITGIEQDQRRLLEVLYEDIQVFQEKGLKVDVVTKSGDPVRKIIQRTRETTYDLVVIGSERQQTQESFLPSAKAYSIIEKIAPPVLLVPKSRFHLKRILICSGGASYIDNAVRFASEIAKDLSATITLLTVVPEPPAMHATLLRRQDDLHALLNSDSELARNLRSEKALIERAGVPVSVKIRHGIVIDQILGEAEHADCDLIVVGSWPVRDLWRNYVIGNVTREIVNRTDRPILVVRSDKELISLADRLRSIVTKLASKKGYTRRLSEA
jgi:nucleotide-binding universal stress UspA family protein